MPKSRIVINCKQHLHRLIVALKIRVTDSFTPPLASIKGFLAITRKITCSLTHMTEIITIFYAGAILRYKRGPRAT